MSNKNNDENVYKLIGFVNILDVVPGFVYPVFVCVTEKTSNLYLQNGENDKLVGFVELKESYRSKVISTPTSQKPCLITVASNPIYAYQMSGTVTLYGDSAKMVDLLKDYKSNSDLVMQEINDFYEEVGVKETTPSKFSNKDFKLVVSEPNGQFVRIDELNQMIEYGAVSIDKQKLKEYVFDSTIVYDREKISREDALKAWQSTL